MELERLRGQLMHGQQVTVQSKDERQSQVVANAVRVHADPPVGAAVVALLAPAGTSARLHVLAAADMGLPDDTWAAPERCRPTPRTTRSSWATCRSRWRSGPARRAVAAAAGADRGARRRGRRCCPWRAARAAPVRGGRRLGRPGRRAAGTDRSRPRPEGGLGTRGRPRGAGRRLAARSTTPMAYAAGRPRRLRPRGSRRARGLAGALRRGSRRSVPARGVAVCEAIKRETA